MPFLLLLKELKANLRIPYALMSFDINVIGITWTYYPLYVKDLATFEVHFYLVFQTSHITIHPSDTNGRTRTGQ